MRKPTKARLEAFSDGVIAVIITIMVLELHVPRAGGFEGLRAVLPTLGIYALSFTFTGIYWINHGHLVDRLPHVDTLILWANLFMLFALSLLPFFTAYLIEKHFDSFSVALYCFSLLLPAIGFQALSLAIGRHLMRDPEMTDAEEQHQHQLEIRKGIVSVVFYLSGTVLAYFHPLIALSLVAVSTLLWIVPTFATQKPISGVTDATHFLHRREP